MPDESKPKGFPGLSSKLSAAPKRSLFERQKAEAEAKRARERAETAAVYEDFVKSFDDDGDSNSRSTSSNFRPAGHSGPGSLGGGPPPKRHFTSSSTNRNSGPGSLGPAPSLARKRTYDGFYRDRDRDSRETGSHGIFGYEDNDPSATFRASDDEEERVTEDKEAERAVAKPTVYLSSLPPGSSPAVIKSLIPQTLTVDGVKIMPPSTQLSTERRSFSAIVTLAQETAASDIDSAVSALQGRYLGWGYYLSISRHLSSAAIHSGMPVSVVGSSSNSSLPFGAKTVNQAPVGRLNRAPPPGPHRGGFAPPSSYGSQYARPASTAQIEVKPPSDLKEVRLIHKTLENLLNYGPEFEALLMSRPEVQREEKWAWIWDARSVGGVWYRWKLWDVLTNPNIGRSHYGKNENPTATFIFEGGANWVGPEKPIRFEYATTLDEFVSDQDYNSSEEEESDNEDTRRRHAVDDSLATQDGIGYMDPMQKAKLTHLLARLPTANTRLRRGDVARVTAFAIQHASAGAEEVVEMLAANVLRPFAYSRANPNREEAQSALRESEASAANSGEKTDNALSGAGKVSEDTSAAKLVGLYVISDIFSSSSTSGVRHAWRYRQLFENAFRAHKVFEHLGRLEKELGWGRLKADKWKRSVGSMLHLWEGWSVFPQAAQEHFIQVFENPPLTEKEMEEEKKKAEAEQISSAVGNKGKSRWKTVDEDAPAGGRFDPSQIPAPEQSALAAQDLDDGLDGEPMSDIDGVPMEDSDLEDAGLDGQPLDMDVDTENNQGNQEQSDQATKPVSKAEYSTPVGRMRRPRPKAEDMFADSDDDKD
jgi:U2-associated protein SR140